MAFQLPPSLQAASPLRIGGTVAATAFLLSAIASGQQRDDVLFSVSWRGPLVGGGTVSAGDILMPHAGLTSYQATPPIIAKDAWQFGIVERDYCNPQQGRPCGDELDALSLGADARLPVQRSLEIRTFFSVDSHATGAGVPLALPSVTTEAALLDQGADVFATRWLGNLQQQDALATGSNYLKIDGDGFGAGGGVGFQQYGSGLNEHNPLTGRWPYAAHDRGDDLDALNLGHPALSMGQSRIYFSLEAGLADPSDPLGTPAIPPSAQIAGFSGADILISSPSSNINLYAGAASLGLDPELDDVDAILIAENGTTGYQRSSSPFSWTSDNSDMVVFSVRRGSAIIGQHDSWLGLRICEGDLLAPPRISGQTPAIIVTAESMGLRSGRDDILDHGDDLDAVTTDITPVDFIDCNENGIEDRLDIVDKASYDFNENGVPDECEYEGEDFCTCPLGSSANCANEQPFRGCTNHTGQGARLACIGPVNAEDTFGFTVYGVPPNATAILVLGNTGFLPAQSGNGLACVAAHSLVGGVRVASGQGTIAYLPGILTSLGASAPGVGETGLYQLWYRDSSFGGCTGSVNWSNGLALTL